MSAEIGKYYTRLGLEYLATVGVIALAYAILVWIGVASERSLFVSVLFGFIVALFLEVRRSKYYWASSPTIFLWSQLLRGSNQSSIDIVEIPTELGKRQEPVIKGKGVPLWVLVSYATKRDMTPQEISQLWNGYISKEEVIAALVYWQNHPQAVEDKLAETE